MVGWLLLCWLGWVAGAGAAAATVSG